MRPDVPFSVRMAVAIMANDRRGADAAVQGALEVMSTDLCDFAKSYDMTDLPFVVASMKLMAQALSSMMDRNGQELADKLVSHTACVAVDMNELMRQAGGAASEEKEGEG